MLNLKVIFLCLFGVSAIHAACKYSISIFNIRNRNFVNSNKCIKGIWVLFLHCLVYIKKCLWHNRPNSEMFPKLSVVVLKHTISKRNSLLPWHEDLIKIFCLIINAASFDSNINVQFLILFFLYFHEYLQHCWCEVL